MESFRIDGNSDRNYVVTVEEVSEPSAEMVRSLLEIDLQSFAEPTFSSFTATAFLRFGRVFVLCADGGVIGTCVVMRSWERPNEAMLLAMGIRPGWRGRGLGQRFVSGVLDKLRARGLRAMSLLVSQDNRRALKVYQDVGFSVVGSHDDVHGGETLLLMRIALSADAGTVIELQPTPAPPSRSVAPDDGAVAPDDGGVAPDDGGVAPDDGALSDQGSSAD